MYVSVALSNIFCCLWMIGFLRADYKHSPSDQCNENTVSVNRKSVALSQFKILRVRLQISHVKTQIHYFSLTVSPAITLAYLKQPEIKLYEGNSKSQTRTMILFVTENHKIRSLICKIQRLNLKLLRIVSDTSKVKFVKSLPKTQKQSVKIYP